jgi:hypothetical protein
MARLQQQPVLSTKGIARRLLPSHTSRAAADAVNCYFTVQRPVYITEIRALRLQSVEGSKKERKLFEPERNLVILLLFKD